MRGPKWLNFERLAPGMGFGMVWLALCWAGGMEAMQAGVPESVDAGKDAEVGWLRPSVRLTGESWSNLDGGLDTGSGWNLLVDLCVEIDLGKVAGGPDAGSLILEVLGVKNREGGGFGEHTGAFNPASGTMAGDALRIYNLHYRQAWDDERLVMKIGQMAADDDFMGSEHAGMFLNSSFGAMPSQVGSPLAWERCDSGAFPVFAVASPGVFVSFSPDEGISYQAAAYLGAPGADRSGNHGFDWETGGGTGVALICEGGWHHHTAGLHGTVKAGATLHTGIFEDHAAREQGVPDATERGIHSFYLIADQTLIVDEKGGTRLGAFCRCGYSPRNDRSTVGFYQDSGMVWYDPFHREGDAMGLALAHTRMGRAYRDATGCAAGETTVELTYHARITGNTSVHASIQYLLDPVFAESGGGTGRALLAGLRTEITF